MDDKSDLRNIKSSLQFLHGAIACLAVLCIALIGASSWLFAENQFHYKSLAALRESNDILMDEVKVLKEWKGEQSITFRKPGGTIQTNSEVKSRQKRQSESDQGILLVALLNSLAGLRGLPGHPGIPGRDGEDGEDGEDGVDGENGVGGVDGKDGVDGNHGVDGKYGVDGRDGRDAVNLAAVDRHINTTVMHVVDQVMIEFRLAADEITRVAGAVYTRWGRTVCPSMSDLVMKGIAAGTLHTTQGGAAQYICLADDPDLSLIQPTSAFNTYVSKLSGVEYQLTDFPSGAMHDQNAPCVICQTKGRTVQSMFPAKSTCPDSTWTKEYAGFLMTEYNTHYRTQYVCVDSQPESTPDHDHNTNGALWYHTVADCSSGYGALGACPPYTANTVILCVVCSK